LKTTRIGLVSSRKLTTGIAPTRKDGKEKFDGKKRSKISKRHPKIRLHLLINRLGQRISSSGPWRGGDGKKKVQQKAVKAQKSLVKTNTRDWS